MKKFLDLFDFSVIIVIIDLRTKELTRNSYSPIQKSDQHVMVLF